MLRICWSTLYSFILTLFPSACIFISYIWLGVYNIGNVTYRLEAALYVWLALSLAGSRRYCWPSTEQSD
jgi:hypothetical protein